MPTHPDATPVPLRRIRRVSLLLARLCLLLILALPVAVAAYWMTASPQALAAQAKLAGLLIEQPPAAWQRGAGLLITLASLGLMLIGMWHVRACFLLFAQGRFFEMEVILRLRRFAGWTCGAVLGGLLSTPLLSVLLTLHNGPGKRQLMLGLSSEHLFTLFIAGLVWLVASVMTHAAALAEENAQFV